MNKVLNRRCRRPLTLKLGRLITQRTNGRLFRRTNYLAAACQALNQLLRKKREMARAHPHLFGPHAGSYLVDTVRAARHAAEAEAAIRKVYGPPRPDDPPPPPGVWSQRYGLDPQWKGFRRWFHHIYGASA